MRAPLALVLTVLAAALALAAPPWFALQEAQRQAYDMQSGQVNNYARNVLHRTEKTLDQALHAIEQVQEAGAPHCSPSVLALMRKIDLTSSYIQAIGQVRDGVMECSSVGGPPVPLGQVAFHTARGTTVYGAVPLTQVSETPLLGVARGKVVVLVHRDLPLDIWTATPEVSLAVVDLGPDEVYIARGHIDPHWPARIGDLAQTSFVDGGSLVAIVRSPRYPDTAVIAAVPVAELEQSSAAAARRLVPASLFAGLAAAAAIVLLARRQMSIASALRAGLRRGEFFLLYQPVVDLESGACTGVEALLRWRRGTGELVSPDLFIPIAERSGLITRVTERVFALVEADAGPFLAVHPDFHVGINLSAADLQSSALAEYIDRLLERSSLQASNLIVEITERSFLHLDSARSVIAALRARGIEVAIDDFGTGYSSLSYLESLELDFLKIDRSFIEAIGTGAPTSQVVVHIIAMARTLGLAMIGEGVESEAQRDFLRAHGVQYAQGWQYGGPMSFADAARAARARTPDHV